MTCPTSLGDKNRTVLIAGILMTTTTLHVTSTGTAPLLGMIRSAYSLMTAQAGSLAILPLLAFALISPLAAPVVRRFGMERSPFATLLLICAGAAIRPLPSSYLLFDGIAVIGGGITLGNVLLSGSIKRGFSHSVARLTGAYSLIMGAAVALGSAMVVPLVLNGFGWQDALLMLVCFPLLAFFLWLPQWRSQQHANLSISRALHTRSILHSSPAWQVTLFFGIDPLAYYAIIGQLLMILVDHGYSEAQAGSLHGLLQLATAAPGSLILLFLHRMEDQCGITAFVALMCAMDTVGLYFVPAHTITWALLFGFGPGITMILGLTFIGLRAGSTHQTAAPSGMAQSVGYLLAACGSPLMGKIHDVNGDWSVPLLDVATLSLLMAIFRLYAGRDEGIRQYPMLQ